ncbi:efflux RND transporter periplasmic adaptor subunit [Tepidibacillus sp. LV47]|uniref:efflux RND transporter periplasmic adaptor subunit n=1 Tax=Tepidibacillus sp. LV47 TaxID=3398228 RepID=UPI003AAF946D
MLKQLFSKHKPEMENSKSDDLISYRKKRQKKIVIITSVLLVLLAGGVYGYQRLSAPKPTNQVVKLIPVQKGDVTETISATGTVQATKRVVLNFPNGSGQITTVNVKVGDQVKAGQVLATVDSSSLSTQVKIAQANLSAAKARLEEVKKGASAEEIAVKQQSVNKAKLSLDIAKSNYEEQKKLYSEGKIDQLQLEQAKNNVDQAQANYNMEVAQLNQLKSPPKSSELQSAQASVDQAYYQLQQAQNALANATLKAPMDGVIVEVNGEVGEIPSSGGGSNNGSTGNSSLSSSTSSGSSKSSGFIVMDNSNSGELEVISQVSQNDIGKVKIGMNATFTTTSFEGKKFTGKVTAISPEATTQSGVTTYSVKLSVDNKEQLLMPGMTVNTTIIVGTHTNTLYVPAAALKEQNGKMGVMVQTTNGRSRFQEVTIGYYSTDKVEILSGLKEGDQVVLTFQLPSSTNNERSNQFRLPGTGGNRIPLRGDR